MSGNISGAVQCDGGAALLREKNGLYLKADPVHHRTVKKCHNRPIKNVANMSSR